MTTGNKQIDDTLDDLHEVRDSDIHWDIVMDRLILAVSTIVKQSQDFKEALIRHQEWGNEHIKMHDAYVAAQSMPCAAFDSRCNQLTERSVGAMAIADGEEGYEKVPIDCPMLAAVSELRSKYNALRAELSRRDNSQTALPKAAV
jgi:hypothetical protein